MHKVSEWQIFRSSLNYLIAPEAKKEIRKKLVLILTEPTSISCVLRTRSNEWNIQ